MNIRVPHPNQLFHVANVNGGSRFPQKPIRNFEYLAYINSRTPLFVIVFPEYHLGEGKLQHWRRRLLARCRFFQVFVFLRNDERMTKQKKIKEKERKETETKKGREKSWVFQSRQGIP